MTDIYSAAPVQQIHYWNKGQLGFNTVQIKGHLPLAFTYSTWCDVRLNVPTIEWFNLMWSIELQFSIAIRWYNMKVNVWPNFSFSMFLFNKLRIIKKLYIILKIQSSLTYTWRRAFNFFAAVKVTRSSTPFSL